MKKPIDFDIMSDRCLSAADAVMKVGSPELQAAMRVVLTVLGREIAQGMTKPALAQVSVPPNRRYAN